MDLQLDRKSALVTGASRGLGFATARLLALEGCQVAVNSRDRQSIQSAAIQIQSESGSETVPLEGDLTDPEIPSRLVTSAVEAFGGLDILVTNSGGPPPGAFQGFDDKVWEAAVELNFLSHVRLIRAALPHLRQSPAASVLTVTSITVKQPITNLVLSNSVRAATAALTKTLALELGSEGIRFNSILPSWTQTERVEELMTNRASSHGTTKDEEIEKQAQESPFGRMGQPEEFAKAAVFLLSPAASYLTGLMLNFDGGMYKGTF